MVNVRVVFHIASLIRWIIRNKKSRTISAALTDAAS
jgi:hypothetical protein